MPDYQEQQNEEEFEGSLYEHDNKKKTIKIVVIVLAVFAVISVVMFMVLRKKDVPAKTQLKNTQQINESATGAQTVSEEEIKRVQMIIAQFADDMDRDGLSVDKEKELGTSDSEFDTDWDGVPDKDEVDRWGTDPTKADTDDDGFSDGFEINSGFNPKGQGKLL